MPLADTANYPLWLNAAIFLAAAIVIWLAGTRLVAAVDRIAGRTGMGQAFAGMLLLGTITSLPEIANVSTASVMGNPALAVNNLLGSASINILLLALLDGFTGGDAVTSVVSRPATLMQAALCMVMLSLVAAAVSTGDVALFGVGAWSLGIAAASIAAFWLSVRYAGRTPWQPSEPPPASAENGDDEAGDEVPLRRLVLQAAAAGAIILVAGYTLSQAGDGLAEQTGLGSGLVGFLLIGIATSMPEFSTLAAALRRRRNEMAIGEVLGTNFVNLVLLLLADLAFAGGPVINEAGPFEALSALLGTVLTGIILVGLLERRNRTILRMGYDSAAVLLVFAAGVGLLYAVR